jgi:ornithine carbamoyltransferase
MFGANRLIAAAFVEEPVKASAVVIVLVMLRAALQGPVDGLIVGFFVGFGFAVIEDVLYTAGATNGQAAWLLVVTRAMTQLGGHALYLGMQDLQLRRGETVSDTAKVISRYCDVMLARVVSHDDIAELGANATVPVINGLSDKFHPTQAMADMLTLQENFGQLKGLRLAYLGDGNNIRASLILQGAAHGLHVVAGSPKGYQPAADIVTQASWLAAASGGSITVTDDPYAAATDADAVYTDVHVSMGMADSAARAVALAPYKVTPEIMAVAKPNAIFMHDLPMHRGEEVEAAVADGPQSVIFDQAENRMHAHKALLMHLLC